MRKLRIDGDIYKSNPLIEASINMNTIMGRIYTLGLLQVYPDLTGKLHPTDFETVRIPAKKVKELCGSDNNDYYRRLKKAVREQNVVIMLKDSDDPKDGFSAVTLYETLNFDVKEGLTLKFNKALVPYVLDLNGRQYTRIAAKHIFALSSNYSIRILELLLEYKNIDYFKRTGIIERKIDIEQLRWFCGVPENKYNRKYDLIKYVLKAPIEEINKVTPFKVWYELIKNVDCKTVIVLRMIVPAEENQKIVTDIKTLTEEKNEAKKRKSGVSNAFINDSDADIKDIMITYGVGKIVAARLAKSYPREHIINNIRYSLSQQHRVRNMGAYIARAIKEDYYSSRGTDDGIKSLKQLEEDYKVNLETFLEEYGLPSFWATEFMDDDRISANRRNTTFARKAAEQGFDLESLLISVQKRQIPEPPKFEKMEKLVPESEINTAFEPVKAKDYPRNTDLEKKLQNPWTFHQIIDYVRDGKALDHFVEPRVIIKGLTLDEAISEAKRILNIDTADEAPSENTIEKEPIAQTDKMAELRELFNMYQAGFLTEDDVKKMKENILSK